MPFDLISVHILYRSHRLVLGIIFGEWHPFLGNILYMNLKSYICLFRSIKILTFGNSVSTVTFIDNLTPISLLILYF